MGILGLNEAEDDKKECGVPVKEDVLSPTFLPDRLPAPEDAIHVTEGRMEGNSRDRGLGRHEGKGWGVYKGRVGTVHGTLEGVTAGHGGSTLDGAAVVN